MRHMETRKLTHLFESNRAWAKSIRQQDPQFFEKLSQQQSPGYLWIGCSDSRVPANQIVDLLPGELMLSPMGLSLVSKVAPVRFRGIMMGGWFIATAIGNKLTQIGELWDDWLHSSFWLLPSALAVFMAIVLLFLLRPLKKAMPGV